MIMGDTAVKGLSLSNVDEKILTSQVSVVFHMAANVKFDLPLKTAVKTNIVGTANVVALAKQVNECKSSFRTGYPYERTTTGCIFSLYIYLTYIYISDIGDKASKIKHLNTSVVFEHTKKMIGTKVTQKFKGGNTTMKRSFFPKSSKFLSFKVSVFSSKTVSRARQMKLENIA